MTTGNGAFACNAKVEVRRKTCWALNNLDWGKKTRWVCMNDDGCRGARCPATAARIGGVYE